jgi:putative spermidine/putrescine transport system permease protein
MGVLGAARRRRSCGSAFARRRVAPRACRRCNRGKRSPRQGTNLESRTTGIFLRVWSLLVVLFLYVPLAVIVLYAFNRSNVQTWPIEHFSTRWFRVAWNDQEVRDAFTLSLKVACAATVVALVLGTAAAFAVARYRFFGVNAVSFLVVIPIALPGVITGIALQSSFAVAGIPFSLWTIMVGHATFCIVIVFNNVLARLRRMQPSIEDASMDLGANGLQTFRYVLLPELRSALVAGALLAFALSWDEVIVTIFTAGGNTTIPIWIWTGLRTGGSGSEINVVAAVVVVLSIVPVYFAQRLTTGGDSRSEAPELGTLAAVAGSQSLGAQSL